MTYRLRQNLHLLRAMSLITAAAMLLIASRCPRSRIIGSRTELEVVDVRAMSPGVPGQVGGLHGVEVIVRNNGDDRSLPVFTSYRVEHREGRAITIDPEVQIGPQNSIPGREEQVFSMWIEVNADRVSAADKVLPSDRVFINVLLTEERRFDDGTRTLSQPYEDGNNANNHRAYSFRVAQPVEAVEIEFSRVRVTGACFSGAPANWGFSIRPWRRHRAGSVVYGPEYYFPGPGPADSRLLNSDEWTPMAISHRFHTVDFEEDIGAEILAGREGGSFLFFGNASFSEPAEVWTRSESRITVPADGGSFCAHPTYEIEVIIRAIR